MDPILVGIGAFVILGIMFVLLWLSSRREEREDTITQEIIVKANTGPVVINAEAGEPAEVTQEEED